MIQIYAPASAFMLAFCAAHWRTHGGIDLTIRTLLLVGAVAGAILSAKVLL